ncbi:hypothetical protein [Culicoidibacter larvae]|uniref:Uncharacterized protein n=1 Tax=Culicoidibacter larvae TaxID=2579976 RepID=A0A5R8Q6W3_9FIRM|nr:hypothetical protein [Culicoidibacter larvae]TLG71160.1 hypothetical protein FEZ08_11440 [Culicoidibacter larvae]
MKKRQISKLSKLSALLSYDSSHRVYKVIDRLEPKEWWVGVVEVIGYDMTSMTDEEVGSILDAYWAGLKVLTFHIKGISLKHALRFETQKEHIQQLIDANKGNAELLQAEYYKLEREENHSEIFKHYFFIFGSSPLEAAENMKRFSSLLFANAFMNIIEISSDEMQMLSYYLHNKRRKKGWDLHGSS